MKLSLISEAQLEQIDEQSVDKITWYTIQAIANALNEYKAADDTFQQSCQRLRQTLHNYGFKEGQRTAIGELKTAQFDKITVLGMSKVTEAMPVRGYAGSGGFRKSTPVVTIKLYTTWIVGLASRPKYQADKLLSMRHGLRSLIYHELRHVHQRSKLKGNKAINSWEKGGGAGQRAERGEKISDIYSKINPQEIDAQAAALARMYKSLPPSTRKRIRSFDDLIQLFPTPVQMNSQHKFKKELMHKIAKLTDLG